MKIFIILALAAVVLLIGEHCEASLVSWFPDASYDDAMYVRASGLCHDKLEEWSKASTASGAAGESPPRSSGGKKPPLYNSYFMRGKWKPFSGGSSFSEIRPSFINAHDGKFDFYSGDFESLSVGAVNGLAQNISGRLYFWSTRNQPTLAEAGVYVAGVFDSHSGEVCMVGCSKKSSVSKPGLKNRTASNNVNSTFFTSHVIYNDEDCDSRLLMTLSHEKETGRKVGKGTFESLRNLTDSRFFTTIKLDGKMASMIDQRRLYRWDMSVKAIVFASEVVIIMWQIFHSIRSPASYFVSMLMILVQIVVVIFLWFRLIYIPHLLMILRRFKHLFLSGNIVPIAPVLGLMFVIFLNVIFLLVVLRKRLVAKRLNVVERPQEQLLAVICLGMYAIAAVIFWPHNFESFVQVVWCWFLLPQVVANVFWDLRLQPLHEVYVVGISLCRILYIGFNAARPTIFGFDDLDGFPHGWVWGITGTVLVFGTYALLQQYYGGRCFLPQRWFGYKALPTWKTENFQEQPLPKEEDTMLDL